MDLESEKRCNFFPIKEMNNSWLARKAQNSTEMGLPASHMPQYPHNNLNKTHQKIVELQNI
uniref:Uncharacterized protein n=1 Tax=Arundo donax TaxID=35708 RepID=A0A0A9FLJ7_ARUDO